MSSYKQKKNPHARTVERFKYRNAAVMQGGILGVDKLVLITMCEFAHDDGILYHGLRSLAVATGLKKDKVARSIKRLCSLYGVILRIEKGRGRRHASRYKILIDAMPEITVYDLVKAKNRKENEKNAAQASPTETVENRLSSETVAGSSVSPARQSNSTVSHRDSSETNRLTEGTKDVDVASKMLTQVEGVHVNTLGTDAPPLAPEEQNQKQPRTGSSSRTTAKAKPDPACGRHPDLEAVCYIRPDSIGDGAPRYACDECFRAHKEGYELNRMTFRGTYGMLKPTTVRRAEATPSFQCDDSSKENYVRPL